MNKKVDDLIAVIVNPTTLLDDQRKAINEFVEQQNNQGGIHCSNCGIVRPFTIPVNQCKCGGDK